MIRMSVTAGWIIGPVIGTSIAAAWGTRAVLLVTAFSALAQIIPLGTIRSRTVVPHTERSLTAAAPISARTSLRAMMPLLVFTALCLNINASEAVKHAFLPIYMTDHLELSPTIQGIVIGSQPFVEFPLIPVAVVLARRWGALPLIAIAAGIAVIGNVVFALAGGAIEVLIAQVLMGVVWGIFAAMGIIVAQRLLPTAVATASGVFMSSGAIGSAFGGFTGGLGAEAFGLPEVFFLPAIFCLVAAIGLVALHMRT